MMDFNDPVNNRAANVLGTVPIKHNEVNTLIRKIQIDRGMPLSLDFESNYVKTIDFSIKSIILFSINKILIQPLHMLIILIITIYSISWLLYPLKIKSLNVSASLFIHALLIFLEIFTRLFDMLRIYFNDSRTNKQLAYIYDMDHKCFVSATWGDIRVGHVIKVNKDEIVPADVIIIETLDSSHSCDVDVSALTGVFDSFIVKKACFDTQTPSVKTVKFNEYIKNIKGVLKYEEPNSNMNSFTGRLKLESFPRASNITEDNFIMRGSTVKNIKCIYALVVYTGMETKIMQILKNDKANNYIVKQTRNIIQTGWSSIQFIIIALYLQIVIILLLSQIHKCYINYVDGDAFYVNRSDAWGELFYSIIQYLLTFHLIIPFSWFNLSILSFFLFTSFVKWDIKILQKSKNTVDIINSDCLPDFGQVKYILTDKTGTLTSRKFTLKACSIQGKIFTFDPIDQNDDNYLFRMKKYEITDLELYKELNSNTPFSVNIKAFFEYLCVCHSVRIRSETSSSKTKSRNNIQTDSKKNIVFSSSKAEEKAILNMMSKFGYLVTNIKSDKIMIKVNEEKMAYSLIGVNKYSEQRKRMSVIVRKFRNDPESILLCKGNDLSIFKYMKSNAQNKLIYDQIQKFSLIGYRFFVFCKKDLSEDETNSYLVKYKSTENYVLYQDSFFEKLATEYECEMDYVGVLFFEEKVSAELRYSLNRLSQANINVWVVSGDRKENVMAVSRNLDMYSDHLTTLELSDTDDLDDLDIKMNMFLLQFLGSGGGMMKMKTRQGLNINVEAHSTKHKSKSKNLTILIHGACFNAIYNDSRLFQCFVTLLSYTTTLFAYSFTANHKFLLCQTVKKLITKNSKVLAIGDGLNDFMMLKEADLSIGIRSREILQVRNTCDIIVSKFPQIVDIILVHGTWNTRRVYSICLFSLYSNILIISPFFHYQKQSNEGSSFLFVNYTKLTFDILIINLTIVLIFCFDQSIERPLIGLNSSVYMSNFKNQSRVIFSFFKYVVKGVFDSCIIYYCFYLAITNPINIEGETIDGSIFGFVILHTTYLTILVKLFTLKLNNINLMTIILSVSSISAIFGVGYFNNDLATVSYQSISYLTLVLFVILSVYTCYLYERVISYFFLLYDPSLSYLIAVKFQKLIDNYTLFTNINEIQNEIAIINQSVKNKVNIISYQEVMSKIYDQYKGIDPVLENMTDADNDKLVKLKIQIPFLKFYDEKSENDYLLHFPFNLSIGYFGYLIIRVFYLIVDLSMSVNNSSILSNLIIGFKIIHLLFGFILLLKRYKMYFTKNFVIFYFITITIQIISIYIDEYNNDVKICCQIFIIFSYPLFFGIRKFKPIIIGVVFYTFAVIPALFINDFGFSEILNNPNFLYLNFPLIYHRGIIILAILAVMIIYGYSEELASRAAFLKFNKKTLDYKKDWEIYSNLVPEFIREKMKDGVRGATAAHYEIVTILFCDILDFDNFVASMSPKDMINLLDRIYNTFDQLCSLHGLQKIETVGKTYMAAGGLKETERDIDSELLDRHHAIRTFELARDMLDVIQKITLENGDLLKIKIGIHTGKVIAAVVGNHKPQFSLIGDTINTTARMCAYSEDMCINCSENAYEHIYRTYNDCTISKREVKGKGAMNLYLFRPFKKNSINETDRPGYLHKDIIISRRNSKYAAVKHKTSLRNVKRRSNSLKDVKFLYENSESMSEGFKSEKENNLSEDNNNNHNICKKNEKLEKATPKYHKKRLSKIMKEISIDGFSNNINSADKNPIFSGSCYFFIFCNNKTAKDLYESFNNFKFKDTFFKARTICLIYFFTMIIAMYHIYGNYMIVTQTAKLYLQLKALFQTSLLLLLNQFSNLKSKNPIFLRVVFFIIFLLITLVIQFQMNNVEDFYLVNLHMEQDLTLIVISFSGILTFRQCAANLILHLILFSINTGLNIENKLFTKYLYLKYAICTMIFTLMMTREYQSTFEFLQNKSETEKLKKIEKLLFNMMPQHVVQNLKEDIPVADVIYNVTMLFADIVKFTDYSSQRQPVEVVEMLTELFKEFDDNCQKFNVYKVHTIGDCYVVMSFTGKVPMNERNFNEEAKNIIKMGESMIETIKTVRKAVEFEELNMRIGIHTGTVIAGVIGTKVVRYDIFGSDVLIANKMESGGVIGKICVSEDTKNLLELDTDNSKSDCDYVFTENKKIHVGCVDREINSFVVETAISRNESFQV